MKRLAFCFPVLLALVVALFVPTQLAAAPVRTQTAINFVLAEQSACSVTPESYLIAIVNASSIYDCDATGGGNTTAVCLCDGGSIRGAIVDDIAGYVLITFDGNQSISATGAGHDFLAAAADDNALTGNDILLTGVATLVATAPVSSVVASTSFTVTSPVQLQTASTSATVTSPVQVNTASTSILNTTPKASFSGVIERAVTNVTVADDAAGTKPTGAIPITTDFATCTCNDATGCTMSIAEPTVTAGYGRSLTIASIGTGNCEFADSAGVTEIGAALVVEPTSTVTYAYINAAWHLTSSVDNVP